MFRLSAAKYKLLQLGRIWYVKFYKIFVGVICRGNKEDLWFLPTDSYFIWFLCPGDYTPESDIDIMVLVNLSEKEIFERGRNLSDVTFEYNFNYNIEIKPVVKNIEHFNRWIQAYPFYYNVKKEGIELYAA